MEQRAKDWPSVVTTVLCCLWLGVFPLWQDLTYTHITRTKWLGMLALCTVTVLTCLSCILILGMKGQLRFHLQGHPVLLAAVGYFLWVGLSAWQGSWADTLNGAEQLVVWMGAFRHEGLLTHLCYGLIFLMLSLFPPKLAVVCQVAGEALLLFLGVTALQYAGLNPLGLYPEGRSIYTSYEFQGTIGNIDMVSGYLCLVIPLLLGRFATMERGGWHLLGVGSLGAMLVWCMEVQSNIVALAAFCGLLALLALWKPAYRFRVCLVLSGVMLALGLRGSLFLPWLDGANHGEVQPIRLVLSWKLWLGLGGSGVLMLLAWLLKKHPGRGMSGRAVICLALAAVVIIAALAAVLPIPESAGGLYELHECLNGRMQDAFGSWRLGVWRCSLAMSREHLLFGSGPDTFYFALRHYLDATGTVLGENFDNPHNEYLAILVNNGLPALLLYVLLLGWMLYLCLRREQWCLGLALGCFALQGCFSFSICLVSPMFWAVAGMAVSSCKRERNMV